METIVIILFVVLISYIILSSKKKNNEDESVVDSIVDKFKFELDLKYESVKKNFDNFIASSLNDIRANSNDPTYDSNVINVAVKGLYYRSDIEKENARKLIVHEQLFLERETDNKIDSKAIKVLISDNIMIGYVEERYSNLLCRLIESGYSINCFVSKITNNYIPYIYMDVFFAGHKTITPSESKKIKQKPEVVYVDYKQRISQLKENIKRSKDAADKATRENIRENALKRVEQYQLELENLQRIRDENEN